MKEEEFTLHMIKHLDDNLFDFLTNHKGSN